MTPRPLTPEERAEIETRRGSGDVLSWSQNAAILSSEAYWRERAERLTSMLNDALNEWADAAQYQGEYLLKKHGDMEEIARMRAALAEEPQA